MLWLSREKTLENMFYDIIEYLRGIEITLLVDNPDEILEVGEEVIEVYRKLSSFTSLEKLQLLLESLSTVGRMLHDFINKHVFIETAIMKAMRYSSSIKVSDIIKKLNELKGLGSSPGDSQSVVVPSVVPAKEKVNAKPYSEPVNVPPVKKEIKQERPRPIETVEKSKSENIVQGKKICSKLFQRNLKKLFLRKSYGMLL